MVSTDMICARTMQFSEFVNNETAHIALGGLDIVETKPIFFLDQDEDGTPVITLMKNHCATYNATTRTVISPATKSYGVLQHIEAFSRVLSVINEAPVHEADIRYYVEGLGNLARLWVLIPSAWNDPNLVVGMRITNSYDMTISLLGELLVWYIPGDFPIVVPDIKHLGPRLALPHRAGAFKKLEVQTHRFVQNTLSEETRNAISGAIERTREIPITFDSEAEKVALLKSILVGKKHSAKLAPRVPDHINRWDLFLLIAEYIHTEDLTVLMREIITQRLVAFLRKPGPGWDNFSQGFVNGVNFQMSSSDIQ